MDNRVLALIAGFIAMALVATSYFVKKKLHYLIFQLLGILFLIVSYFFTVQFFAMVGLLIGAGRTITFAIYEQKGKTASIAWPFFFSFLSIASYAVVNLWILGTARPVDILFLVGLVGYAFIFRIRDLRTVRFLMLAPTVLSVLYNVFSDAAVFVTVSYFFELAANIVSIFKYHVFNKEKALPTADGKNEGKNFQTP